MYLEFFHPRYTQLWERTKQLTDAKIMLHCCGGIYPAMFAAVNA